MTNQKMTSKRQNVIIAILAVLLVGLLAFNVTYAFFTDKENNTDKFTFGSISLKANTDDSIVQVYRNATNEYIQANQLDKSTGVILPGDKIRGEFQLDLKDDSEDAFVRFKLDAKAEYKYLYEEDTKVVTAGQVEGSDKSVIAYINGEIIQAVIGDETTIYKNDGTGAYASTDEGVAAKIEAVEAYKYIASYKLNSVTQSITFEFDSTNNVVKATITGANSGTDLAATSDEVKAYLEQSNADLVRIADIDDAVEAINDAFHDASVNLTAGTKYNTTDYSKVDGYIYRNAALRATDAAEVVDFIYTLPLVAIGNALQGVTIHFDLLIEAVQAANVDAAVADLAGVDGVTEANTNAVKMFYAVTNSNTSPVPANYSDN